MNIKNIYIYYLLLSFCKGVHPSPRLCLGLGGEEIGEHFQVAKILILGSSSQVRGGDSTAHTTCNTSALGNEHPNYSKCQGEETGRGKQVLQTPPPHFFCLCPRSHLQGFILRLGVHPFQLPDEVAQVGDLGRDPPVVLTLGLHYLLLRVLQPHQEEPLLLILELMQLLEHRRDFPPLGSRLLLQGTNRKG